MNHNNAAPIRSRKGLIRYTLLGILACGAAAGTAITTLGKPETITQVSERPLTQPKPEQKVSAVDTAPIGPTSKNCYLPESIGKVGDPDWTGCARMLIVDDEMLKSAGASLTWWGDENGIGDGSFEIPHNQTSYTFAAGQSQIFTGQVTSLSSLFTRTSFNSDISHWDTSNVDDMGNTFHANPAFNQDISRWDTSKVITLWNTFKDAKSFNQDIGAWDTANVVSLLRTFQGAKSFNQDISAWDTSSVTFMESAFEQASSFNQDISSWDVSSLTHMKRILKGANSFEYDITSWIPSEPERENDTFAFKRNEDSRNTSKALQN